MFRPDHILRVHTVCPFVRWAWSGKRLVRSALTDGRGWGLAYRKTVTCNPYVISGVVIHWGRARLYQRTTQMYNYTGSVANQSGSIQSIPHYTVNTVRYSSESSAISAFFHSLWHFELKCISWVTNQVCKSPKVSLPPMRAALGGSFALSFTWWFVWATIRITRWPKRATP